MLAVVAGVGAGLLVTALVAGALTGPPGEEAPARPLTNEQAEDVDRNEPGVATEDEALERDAAGYAEAFDVPLEEAIQRLRWQQDSGPTMEALAGAAPGRFAGTWIEHEPTWRVVAMYTGSQDGLSAAFEIAANAPVPVEVRSGATYTEGEIEQIVGAVVDDLGPHAAVIRWVHSQAITVLVLQDSPNASDPAALAVRLEAEYGLPAEVIVVDALIRDQAEVYGGSHAAAFAEADLGDAAAFAEGWGVTLEEAIQVAAWQVMAGDIADAIREAAPGRVAAIHGAYEDGWRLVARFTGGDAGLDAAREIARSAPFPVDIVTGARYSESELASVLHAITEGLAADGFAGAMAGIQVHEWTIFVLLPPGHPGSDHADDLAEELATRHGMAVHVSVAEPHFLVALSGGGT